MSRGERARVAMGPVRCSTLGIRDLLDLLRERLRGAPRAGLVVNFVNAHLFNLCWSDRAFCALVNESDIVAADGMAIVWASRLFGMPIPARCNMTDAFRAFLADPDMPAAEAVLIGGTDEEARLAADAIERQCPRLRIARALSGFRDADAYAAALAEGPPADLILLGMGSPKSERVAKRLRQARPEAIIWHIGGGTVMFFAGRLVEAPAWMRRCGLQWLHRLAQEPGRMWRRYLLGNPLFVARILRARLFRDRRPQDSAYS